MVVLLAVVIAQYVLWVLHKNRKWGWQIAFLIMVVVPTVLAFIDVGNIVVVTALSPFPLLTFFYCFVLRLFFGEWVVDASHVSNLLTQERDRPDKPDL